MSFKKVIVDKNASLNQNIEFICSFLIGEPVLGSKTDLEIEMESIYRIIQMLIRNLNNHNKTEMIDLIKENIKNSEFQIVDRIRVD